MKIVKNPGVCLDCENPFKIKCERQPTGKYALDYFFIDAKNGADYCSHEHNKEET